MNKIDKVKARLERKPDHIASMMLGDTINWKGLASVEHVSMGITTTNKEIGSRYGASHTTRLVMNSVAQVFAASIDTVVVTKAGKPKTITINKDIPLAKDMTARDRSKCDKALVTISYNLKAQTKGTTERLKAIDEHIKYFQKLSDNALDGEGLRDQMIEQLYRLYCWVTMRGLDDSHHHQNIPVDAKQSFNSNSKRGAIGWIFHRGKKTDDIRGFTNKDRITRRMRDSKYPDAEDQYLLLKLTDIFQKGEYLFAPPVVGVNTTRCKLSLKPAKQLAGFEGHSRDAETLASDGVDAPMVEQMAKQHIAPMAEWVTKDHRLPFIGHSLPIPLTHDEKRKRTIKRASLAKLAKRQDSDRIEQAHARALQLNQVWEGAVGVNDRIRAYLFASTGISEAHMVSYLASKGAFSEPVPFDDSRTTALAGWVNNYSDSPLRMVNPIDHDNIADTVAA